MWAPHSSDERRSTVRTGIQRIGGRGPLGRVSTLARRLTLVLLLLVLAIASVPRVARASVNRTRSEAVAWANARAAEGWCVDYDGAYGVQCVDLILAYYDYLIGWHTSGNAIDYATGGNGNQLPSGWRREGSPQAGDVVVWNPGAQLSSRAIGGGNEYANSAYGHIGIVTEVRNGYIVAVETNSYSSGTPATPHDRLISGVACFIRPDFNNDHNPPTVSDFHVGEFRDGAFTVLAKVTDDQAMGSVRYAIWSDKDGQDDLVWQDGYCTDRNDIYWSRVNFADHKGERGNYIIHVYAYDAAGNLTKKELSYKFDSEGPAISDVQVTDVSESGYTVTCSVSDAQMDVLRVQFPTWTLYGNQDDLASEWWTNTAVRGTLKNGVATFKVKSSDHNGETGRYVTHIYAYDTLGNATRYAVPAVELMEHTAVDLPSDTSFLIMPLCSQTRGLTLGSVENGSTVQLGTISSDHPGFHQFVFAKDKDGYYGIQSARDCACYLHVTGDSTNHIHAWRSYGNGLSRWIPQRNTDGSYSFWNPSLETYMDTQRLADADGTYIISHPSNGGSNQKYRLVPVDKPIDAGDVTVTCSESVELKGGSAVPEITVEYLGVTLVEGEDYTVAYKGNEEPGTATATITGVGGVPSSSDLRGFRGYYTGSRTVEFEVVAGDNPEPEPIDLSGFDVTLSETQYTCDGTEKKPTVTVKSGDKVLTADADYVVSYRDNVETGTATVLVTGINAYSGSVEKQFTIVSASPAVVKGDVTGDGDVTIADVVKLNRYVVGKIQLTPEELAAADVTGDDDVTIADVVKLNRYVIGKIEQL